MLVTRRNPSFPGFFFVHEHFARFLTTVHQRVEPWWYFLPLLLLGVLPWLAALVHAARSAAPPTLMHAGTPADPRFKPVRFLLIFAGVTLAFFSASGSKLAPYILPMLPVLAAVAGIYAPDPQAFVRRAARSGARAGGGGGRRTAHLLPASQQLTCRTPPCTGALRPCSPRSRRCSTATVRRRPQAGAAALVTALAGVLAWQCLLCEYGAIPPERSARELVDSVRPLITPQTPLYSVGQYRETLSPYLGRTLQLVGFEGELEFGLHGATGAAHVSWSSLQRAGAPVATPSHSSSLDSGMRGGGGACRAA